MTLSQQDIEYIKKLRERVFETEDQLQSAIILMISQMFPLFRYKVWHTQNEQYISKKPGEGKKEYEHRCMIIGNMNKAKGKLAGVMDILIIHLGILYKIELKLPGGELNPAQKELHPIWTKDFPATRPIIAFDLERVYLYCKWIMCNGLKITIPQDFKPFNV